MDFISVALLFVRSNAFHTMALGCNSNTICCQLLHSTITGGFFSMHFVIHLSYILIHDKVDEYRSLF